MLARWRDISVINAVACGKVDVMKKVLAARIEVTVKNSVLAARPVVKYTVSGGKVLIWVMKLSEIVRVTAC